MTIETTVTETKQVKKEISLPFYSKNNFGNYYMISEDESVLKVVADKFDAGIYLTKKTPFGPSFLLQTATLGTPVSKEEFEEATQKAVEFMDEALSKFQPIQ